MSKSKTYYVKGCFSINNFDIYIRGKVSAVSKAQANYYCCLDIRKDFKICRFISLAFTHCEGMNSTMNYLRYRLPMGLMYYLRSSNNKLVKQDLTSLKEKLFPAVPLPKEVKIFQTMKTYNNKITL